MDFYFHFYLSTDDVGMQIQLKNRVQHKIVIYENFSPKVSHVLKAGISKRA